MPLRVIQHYSDWVYTAVMSNDVQASAGFEPVTSAIPVQCSTSASLSQLLKLRINREDLSQRHYS